MSKTFTRKGPKRPIDKTLIYVKQTIPDTQVESTLRIAGVAETYSGGHFVGTVSIDTAPAGLEDLVAMIVHVREGQVASTIANFTNGDNIYLPEQDVLWIRTWGFPQLSLGVVILQFADRIKTMRKLKKNDKLLLIARSSAAGIHKLNAVFSGFFKQ